MFVVAQGATLGSQDGAFENVRLNVSGDQGQQIRQLLSSHLLHRVGMCNMSTPSGRRHNLAVCQDKTKVVILQLGALLKQADNSKRKLTLTVSVILREYILSYSEGKISSLDSLRLYYAK